MRCEIPTGISPKGDIGPPNPQKLQPPSRPVYLLFLLIDLQVVTLLQPNRAVSVSMFLEWDLGVGISLEGPRGCCPNTQHT